MLDLLALSAASDAKRLVSEISIVDVSDQQGAAWRDKMHVQQAWTQLEVKCWQSLSVILIAAAYRDQARISSRDAWKQLCRLLTHLHTSMC